MKTPEQMAEEYREEHDECEFARDAFLAGYQAAKDTYKDAIETYEDVAKQMLEEAVRIMSPKDQLADADKVMCNTTMEEIKAVDTGELMPITNLPTPAKWISVKERLPEDDLEVLFFSQEYYGCFVGYKANEKSYVDPEGNGLSVSNIQKYYTHWMPLPEPPKEEK